MYDITVADICCMLSGRMGTEQMFHVLRIPWCCSCALDSWFSTNLFYITLAQATQYTAPKQSETEMASGKAFNQFLVLPVLLMNCLVLLGHCEPQNTEEGDDLLTAACKHTLHFQVCISSLGSVPGSKKSHPKELAEIAINVSTKYAKETLSYVYELKSSSANNDSYNNNSNIYVSRCLSDCADEYSEAIENLQDSAKALGNGEYEEVDTLVSAAMSDAETCEDGFKDLLSDDDNDSTFPLTDHNRYFSELCSNALAITKLLVY
ncbi:hypothetical protein RJT34_33116 [Clitoria ternatea]|uniref:Pectinesterase inhibitor domain-containing protein n=1 Tax=Clitoria ternatea TaxID=43366 RepID=A0AAN9IA49_CLITE